MSLVLPLVFGFVKLNSIKLLQRILPPTLALG